MAERNEKHVSRCFTLVLTYLLKRNTKGTNATHQSISPQSDVLYIYVFCLILIYNFLDIIIRLLLVSIAYQMEVSKPRFFVQY